MSRPLLRAALLTTLCASSATVAAAQGAPTPLPTPAAPSAAVGSWSAGTLHALPGDPRTEFVDLMPAGARVIARIGLKWTGSNYPSAFAPVGADGSLGTVRRSARQVVGGPAFDSRGRGIVAVDLGHSAVGWATLSRNGTVGVAHRLGAAIFGASVAMNARGDVAIAWIDRNSPRYDKATNATRLRLRVAIRPAGGSFRPTETLPLSPTIGNTQQIDPAFTVAVGDGGRVAVAVAEIPVDAGNRVVAWTGTANRGLGPRQTIGNQRSNTDIDAAFTAKGGLVVAWATQSQGEEVSSGNTIRAAALAPGARRFGPMKELDPGGQDELAGGWVRILPASDGSTELVWDNQRSRDTTDISAATVSASGRIGARRTLASGAWGLRTALGAHGAAAVVWDERGGTARGIIRAAGRPKFGAPEPVPASYGQLLFWPGKSLALTALRGRVDTDERQYVEIASRRNR